MPPDSHHQNSHEPSDLTPSSAQTTGNGSSRNGKTERAIHFVLQGKGGVGKSFVASLLAQQYRERGSEVACYDADPVNASFAAIKALNAEAVPVLDGENLDVDQVDRLIQRLLTEDRNAVIDSGAASFVPLSTYLIQNDIAGMMKDAGRQMYVHVIVVGGGSILDTMNGLSAVIESFPASVRIVLWVNEYFGPVAYEGTPLEESPFFRENRKRLHGIMYLARRNPNSHGKNLSQMLERKLTFEEALASDEFMLVAKQRLLTIRREVFDQLAPMV